MDCVSGEEPDLQWLPSLSTLYIGVAAPPNGWQPQIYVSLLEKSLASTTPARQLTHLRPQGPGGQNVPAVVQPLWFHLRVARPVVVWEGFELRRALEDLHVVDERFVPLCNLRFVLQRPKGRVQIIIIIF